MRRSSIFIMILGLIALTAGSAFATNGYQLMGVGSYQKSLGGAVTANPGSAMTAVTNPAGMTRICCQTDFSMEAFLPTRSVDFQATGGEALESDVDMYGVPAIGWAAPVKPGSRLLFGGGMYGTSGMGVDYAGVKMFSPSPAGHDIYWDGYSAIAFWQMAPALAYEVNEKFSVGLALYMDYQNLSFRQRTMLDMNDDGAGDSVFSNFDLGRSASQFGFGLGLGFLYDLTGSFTVAASYKSRQSFSDFEFNLAHGDITDPAMGALPGGKYSLELDAPQQASFGLAFRPACNWVVSADVKWIDWSSTMDKLTVNGPMDIAVPMDPGWDDQTVFAVGTGVKVTPKLNLRAGFNYAKRPFDEGQVSHNLILPAIVETHFAFGGDYLISPNWLLGLHYMAAPERTLTAPVDDPQAPGATIALKESSIGMNFGYRF